MDDQRPAFSPEIFSALVVVMLSGWAPSIQSYMAFAAIVIMTAHWRWRVWQWEKRQAAARANPPDLSWAEIRATDCEAIREILESDERNKLKGALLSGDIVAWGYTRGYVDPRSIPPTFWQNEVLMFGEVDGKPMSYIGSPKHRTWRKDLESPLNAKYYDIHFSKAQLERYFPDRRF